jgi:predicted Zn-dependent peptidase
MTLDRSKAPEYKVPEDFELTPPYERILSNGAKFFFIPTPGLDAFKIEILGKGNRSSLPLEQTLVPSFTMQLLQEGTTDMTGEEIADFFDFYASEAHPILTYGHEGIGLLSTKKHFLTVLPVFSSLFTEAVFPEEILVKRKSQRKLSIKLEKEKTASRASQLFRTCLFGDSHPYGVQVEESHVETITGELIRFYYENMLWQNIEIFVTADFSQSELDELQLQLGLLPNRIASEDVLLPDYHSLDRMVETKPNAVQSSINIGRFSIPKNHPDFIGLSVFNTILGGYFGSRLIKNIREDKGHTYGIYSSMAEIGDSSYWVVSADVQKEFCEEVLKEIYHEITLLASTGIDEDELEVVRNYMIGQMLKQFSSSFDLMDKYRAVHDSNMDFDFYSRKLNFLKMFTSQDIVEIGQKYFTPKKFVEVVVG